MALRTLDPRIKLLILAVLSTVSVVSRSVIVLALMLVFTLVILLAGGIAPGRLLTQSKSLLRIILTLFILQCVFNRSGESLFAIGELTVFTRTGVYTAVLVALRLMIILFSALIMLTGDSRDYLLAMTQWRMPYELAYMVIVAARFVPMLREEAQDVLCAVQMRGVRLKKAPLRRKIVTYAGVLVPIFAGAIHRAVNTAIAMEARAFRAHPKRTYMRRLTLRGRDYAYFAVFCVVTALIIFCEDILCIFF